MEKAAEDEEMKNDINSQKDLILRGSPEAINAAKIEIEFLIEVFLT